MSGRVALRYMRETTILMYSLWSATSLFSSGFSDVVVLINVDTGLSSAMLNFFMRSFVLRLLDLDM
jgi:hypothetical protein